MKKNRCRNCAYRQSIPGNSHIACRFLWSSDRKNIPKGDPAGVQNGWFHFPMNYDPAWMLDECPKWAEQRDPDLTAPAPDPLAMILSLLR